MSQKAYARARSASSLGMPDPDGKPPVTGFVYLVGFVAVLGGFLFGYDTGVVSSAMIYVKDDMSLNYLWTSLIVSVTLGPCAIFSLVAGYVADRFGRKISLLAASILFTIGAAIMSAAVEKYEVLVGRIIVGAAVGFASMTVPAYVAECSPFHIRGLMVTGFQWMITFGIFIASILGGVFSMSLGGNEDFPTKYGWRLMFGLGGIPSIVQFIGLLFMPESPRWLINHGQNEKGLKVLRRMYGDEQWAQYEFNEINDAKVKDDEEFKRLGGGWVITHMFRIRHVRKALLIGCLLQAFQQLSGINTLMYYTGMIIRMGGIKDPNAAIWMSCAVTGVNFICTIIPIMLIERLGRRKLLIISIIGVIISLIILSVGFLAIHNDSTKIKYQLNVTDYKYNDTDLKEAIKKCSNKNRCDDCVTVETCGFCYINKNESAARNTDKPYGVCLPAKSGATHAWDDLRFMDYKCDSVKVADPVSGTQTWADDWCVSTYSWIPIVGMICYLCSFSTGYAPIPWVMNSEIYPNWARSTGASLATFVNWTFDLVIAQTFLLLTEVLMKYGAFFLYMGITIFALGLFYFIVPETKGLQIEEVELLFMDEKKRERSISMKRGFEMDEKQKSEEKTKF